MPEAQDILNSLLYGNGIAPSKAFDLVKNGALQDSESQKKLADILTVYAKQPVKTEVSSHLPPGTKGAYIPELRLTLLNENEPDKGFTLNHEAIHAIEDRVFKAVMADKNAGPEADKFKKLYGELQSLWSSDQKTILAQAKDAASVYFGNYRAKPEERLAFGTNALFPSAAEREKFYLAPEDKNALDAFMQLLQAVPDKYLRTPAQMTKD